MRVALALEQLETRVTPATLTVNTTADVVNPSDGTLSLRDAIDAIDAGNANGLTTGEQGQVSGTFGVNDTIQFAGNLTGQTITLNGSMLPYITQNVTINGLGASNLAISGGGQSSIFNLDGGAPTLNLSGLTLEDGTGSNGSAIWNIEGSLTLRNCTLIDNTAGNGGAIDTQFGMTSITDCSFLDNTTGPYDLPYGAGGAIFNNGGNLMVTDSIFSGNAATDGGAICNGAGSAEISGSIFRNNTATDTGGGVSNGAATMTVSNSTFMDNTANNGGGISNDSPLTYANATLTVNNSTFEGNSATGTSSGGGILNEGTMTATNATLADNSAFQGGGISDVNGGSATLNNTIVADSTSGGDLSIDSGNGSTYSGSNNLIGDGSDLGSFANSLSGDPMLASLAVNNGPLVGAPGNQQYLQTTALLSGSPAIDAGSNALAIAAGLMTDESGAGFPRIVGSAVDIGAFESSVVPSTTFVVTDAADFSQENAGSDDPTDTNGGISLRSAIAAANVDAANGISVLITFSSALDGDTLTLTQGQLELTAGSGITTIDGSNQITVSGGNQSQIFQIDAGATGNIDGLILEDGYAHGSATMNVDGGAIYNAGNLTISNSMLVQNTATADGGAIATYGTLNAINTAFLGNATSTGQGGAIVTATGTTTTLSDCSFVNNTAADGGAISNDATLALLNSTFSGNSAQTGDGGGIANSGVATISGSIFTNNTSAGSGGGLANLGGSMTVSNSTLNGNSAAGGEGGGIYNSSNGSPLTIENGSAVYGNQAPQGVDLENLGGLNLLSSAVASMDNQNPSATDIEGSIYASATSLTASYSAGQIVFTVQALNVQTPPPPPRPSGFPPPPPPQPVGEGTVALYDGNNNVLGTATLNANGQASFTVPAILGSQTPIYAAYFGIDTGLNGSTSAPLIQTVNALAPSNLQTVVNSLEPDNATAVELQASDNNSLQATMTAINAVTAPVVNGSPVPTTIVLNVAPGTYSDITYNNGDPNVYFILNGSSVASGTTVNGQSPALTVSAGNVTIVNVTLTTSTNAPTIQVNGGDLALLNDDILQASTVYTQPAIAVTGGTVNLGTATTPGNNSLSVNSSSNLVSNTSGNAISAVGDTFVVGGTVAIVPPLSFTSLTTSSASAIPGQTVTLTAMVAPVVPGSPTPTGSVDFYDTTTNTDLGTAPLSGGMASLKVSDLALGTHVIQASYSGDSFFQRSNSTLTQVVTNGILAEFDQSHAKHAGSTIPIQIELVTSSGQDISSAGTTVTAVGLAATTDTTDTVGSIDPSLVGTLQPVQAAGNSNPDNVFRVQSGSQPFYMYNLKTPTGLAAGTYRLYFSVGNDPLLHWVTFSVD